MTLNYPVQISPAEEGGFLAQLVHFTEGFTEGETRDEALFMAADVLSMLLEHRLEAEQEIPLPSPLEEGFNAVLPSATVQAAVLLRLAREERSFSDMARALNTSFSAVQRLERPSNSISLRQLEKAAAVLGKKVVLSLE